MWEILCLLIGALAGAGGLFVWARYNKNKAINLLNMDFEAKVDELKDKANEELNDLSPPTLNILLYSNRFIH